MHARGPRPRGPGGGAVHAGLTAQLGSRPGRPSIASVSYGGGRRRRLGKRPQLGDLPVTSFTRRVRDRTCSTSYQPHYWGRPVSGSLPECDRADPRGGIAGRREATSPQGVLAAGGTSPTGRLPWSTGNHWSSSCLSSRTAPRENGGRRGTLDPQYLEAVRANGYLPQTSPIPVSRRPGERRDTRITDPRHRSQVLLWGTGWEKL